MIFEKNTQPLQFYLFHSFTVRTLLEPTLIQKVLKCWFNFIDNSKLAMYIKFPFKNVNEHISVIFFFLIDLCKKLMTVINLIVQQNSNYNFYK